MLLPEGGLIITQHGDPESEEYWVEEEWLEDLIRREGELWDFLCNHYSERLHKDGYHYAWRNDTGGLGFVIYR